MAEAGGPAAAAAAAPAGELLRRCRGRSPPTGVPGDGAMAQCPTGMPLVLLGYFFLQTAIGGEGLTRDRFSKVCF